MGATHVKVGLRSMAGANGSFEADFLVDTDANDCLARASALRGIGIESVVTRAYELADGTTHEYLFGLAQIEVCDEIIAGRVFSDLKEPSRFLALQLSNPQA